MMVIHSRSKVLLSMARLALPLLGMVAAAGCATSLDRRFQSHIDYLASDRLGGRGVGTPGIELAAEYIAKRFEQTGLEPGGDDGTYFQTFSMSLHRSLTDQANLALAGDESERRIGRDFTPFNFSSNDKFDGGVVFCGYAIEAPDRSHDDFKGVDLTGKAALVFRAEPSRWSGTDDPSPHALLRSKVYNVKDRGASALLIVNQRPAGDETDALMEFDGDHADAYGLPAFHVSRDFASAMLKSGGIGSIDELQNRLDAGNFASAELPHVRVSGSAALEQRSAPTRNVIGVLRGHGPLADECVVIGAHYDHLGLRKPMMRKFKGGKLVREATQPQIHNGADDNASGVSGVLEIARMAAAEPTLRRTLVFVAFSGEESGLHGSLKYVESPTCPLDSTVAMLNMDMIGRMPPESRRILVFGADTGTGLHEALNTAATDVGLTVAPSPDMGGRSDHAPFIRKDVPAMHFFTGHHSDYHQPGDDSDKINAAGGAKVLTLVHDVALSVANANERPQFVAVKAANPAPGDPAAPTPSYRVVMGLAPGYADDGKPGMAVEGVTPEGPAEVAGMKAGDRILRIGDKTVANVYDYMAATRKNNPGDTVDVVVSRGDQEITLKVKLSAAR